MPAATMNHRLPANSAWPSNTARVQLVMVALLFAWLYGTTIQKYLVFRWSNDGNWSHGWLIPVFSLAFIWMRREELRQTPAVPSRSGALLLVLSLLAYVYTSLVQRYTYLFELSMLASIGAAALMFAGWRMFRLLWFPIAYLLLAIPIPEGLFVRLTMPLRQLASLLAGKLLGLFPYVEVEIRNVVISFIRTDTGFADDLNVEEACSGMRLMMTFAAIGLAYAYIMKRPLWQRIGTVVACVPVAVFCNMVRVFITGLLVIHGRPELAQGTPHMMLGMATLGLALGLFWLTNYVLDNLFIQVDEPDETTGAVI